MFDAKGSDNHIHGFADGDALFPKEAEVFGTFQGNGFATKVEARERKEVGFSFLKTFVFLKATQDFRKDDVTKAYCFGCQQLVQQVGSLDETPLK